MNRASPNKYIPIPYYIVFYKKGEFPQMKYIYIAFLLSFFSLSTANEYQLGKGFQIGSLPLFIGGYTSIEYEHKYGKNRSLTLDDVAVMVYGGYNNFSYMIELEAEDIYKEVYGDEEDEEIQDHFHIERLYIDYEFNDRYMLRIGKYNSPIGFWNLNPVNVLRDTSSSPIIVEQLFPVFSSGLDLRYTQERDLSSTIHFIAQENKDIETLINDDIYNNFDVNRHYGAGITLQNDALSYQFSAGYFRTLMDDEYYYLLAAFKYQDSSLKIQGEIGTQLNEDESTIPYIAYLQYSKYFQEKHEAIIRIESYHNKIEDKSDSFVVLGYTYRPLYPIALKSEYQWHSYRQENKLLLSISVLF